MVIQGDHFRRHDDTKVVVKVVVTLDVGVAYDVR